VISEVREPPSSSSSKGNISQPARKLVHLFVVIGGREYAVTPPNAISGIIMPGKSFKGARIMERVYHFFERSTWRATSFSIFASHFSAKPRSVKRSADLRARCRIASVSWGDIESALWKPSAYSCAVVA
jgi:hypothetical protein